MAQAIIEFKRGDNITHTFKMPLTSWTAGGKLFFAAKVQPDDDSTDAAAVINKEFTDSDVTFDANYAIYTMNFVAADISSEVSFADGSSQHEYNGEFQFVSADGEVSTFPGDDNYIQTIIYADIRRETT